MPAIYHDEGEQLILDVFLRGAAPPAGFYIGLCSGTPAEATGLVGLTGEPAGHGYTRIALARNTTDWPTLALNAGDYQATSKVVDFINSDGVAWPAVTKAFLCTSADNSGKLISSVDLSATRTLSAINDKLSITYNLKQQ